MSNEAFQEALKQREKRKKREENKSSFSDKEYEQLHWLGLNEKGYTAIRLYGNPWEFRTSPTDVKLVYRSKIVSQTKENSYFYVNWKQTTETKKGREIESGELDKKWILFRFMQSVQAVEWIKVEGKEKKEKRFLNESSKVFKKVDTNKTPKDLSNPYANKFYPGKIVIANVLDPSDLDFHKENKHTKLIASKLDKVTTDDGNVLLFPKPGLPFTVYDEIISKLVNKVGSWDFDIVINRDADASNIYSVSHFSDFAVPKEIKEYCSDKEQLLDFEVEAYDLDSLYPTTSYSKLKYHLLPLFKEWDKEANTNFAEELEELAEEEAIQKAKETPKPEAKQEKSEEPKKERNRTPKTESKDEVSVESLFPKLNSIDPEDKELFHKTFSHIENGKAVWKKKDDEGEKVQLAPCDHCGVEISTKLLECPACGGKFN